MIFYREPELPAGVYTMETVVFDLPSGKSSVRLSTVEVTRDDPATLRMRSLVLVKRAEKVPEKDAARTTRCSFEDVVVSPNLGEAVSKAAKEVGFYFAAYPRQGRPAPESVIELLQNGKPVAQIPMPLPAADARAASSRSADCRSRARTGHLRAARHRRARNRQVVRSSILRIVE